MVRYRCIDGCNVLIIPCSINNAIPCYVITRSCYILASYYVVAR